MFPLRFLFVSTSATNSTKSGDRAETKRKQVSALSPLRNGSKQLFEVLRLGLRELGSNDPRTSITPLPANLIDLRIGGNLPLNDKQRHGASTRTCRLPNIVLGSRHRAASRDWQ
jgi:hypothetical protein